MSWLKRLLGIKTDAEIAGEVNGEPGIRNARRALGRARGLLGDAGRDLDDADDWLEDAEEAEADRLARRPG